MRLKSPLKLLFMKPFRNTQIEVQIEDLKAQLKLESPKGREARVKYVKEMLKDYQRGPDRYPKIERELKKGIRELQGPVDPKLVEKLKERIRKLTNKI